MENIFFFLIWAIAIFLIMRVGCGSHVAGHDHAGSGSHGRNAGSPDLRWIPPEKDVDPVCGKTISTAAAKSAVYDGHVYYFCSRECRERFEAAPQSYLSLTDTDSIEAKEHAHG